MKYLRLLLPIVLTSCAVGSLTSGVSGIAYHANTANSLTAEGEQRIVDRVMELQALRDG